MILKLSRSRRAYTVNGPASGFDVLCWLEFFNRPDDVIRL